MQLQMRDVPGHLESREQLLNIKSSSKVNWVSLAVAHRMAGNYELASQVSTSQTTLLTISQCLHPRIARSQYRQVRRESALGWLPRLVMVVHIRAWKSVPSRLHGWLPGVHSLEHQYQLDCQAQRRLPACM